MTEAIPRVPVGIERAWPGLLRLPGVYRPQHDTRLLVDAIRSLTLPRGAVALDVCAGTGVLALEAIRAGAGRVLAVDISRSALLNAWLNAQIRRMSIRVARIAADELADHRASYDLVVANPPYVPYLSAMIQRVSVSGSTRASRPPRGGHTWDGGPIGRAVLDPLCRALPSLLRPGGTALVVQSDVADIDRTVDALTASGLAASVDRTARVPYGPVMRDRSSYLETHGLAATGAETETIAVIRALREG